MSLITRPLTASQATNLVNPCASECPAPEPAIQSAISHLGERLEDLRQTASLLESRLGTALAPCAPQADIKHLPDPISICQLEDRVRALTNVANGVSNSITSILQRLQL